MRFSTALHTIHTHGPAPRVKHGRAGVVALCRPLAASSTHAAATGRGEEVVIVSRVAQEKKYKRTLLLLH